MRYIRLQALIAGVGMLLVGGLLFVQALGLVTTFVPAAGGTYSEALVGFPQRLNPLLDFSNPIDRDMDRLVFAGLTAHGPDGRPVPALAQGWSVTADGLTYTFVLRERLRWHDGQPITADDVLFTIGRLQADDYPGPADLGRFWRSVQVSKTDARTVVFTLAEPFGPFLDYTSIGLLPQHLLDGLTWPAILSHPTNLKPVGAGPFQLTRLEVSDGRAAEALLETFPDYYGPAPSLRQVRFVFFPDEDAAWDAFRAGEVQGLSQIDADHLAEALADTQANVLTSRLPEYSLIFLNHRNDQVAFFQDKRVRQALLFGLNRQWLVDYVLGGQALVATGPILPGTWAYNADIQPTPYDPAHAAELLDQAGWTLPPEAVAGTQTYVRQKSDRRLEFTLVAPDEPVLTAVAQLAVENWASLGISVTLNSVSPGAVLSDFLAPRSFEAALAQINLSTYPDPDPYAFWHQAQIETGQNYGGYDKRDLSELLEQARVSMDPQERAQLYHIFQSRFADQVPALLLYYPVYNYVLDAKVQNVQIGPLVEPADRFASLRDWFIITRRVIVNQPAGRTPAP